MAGIIEDMTPSFVDTASSLGDQRCLALSGFHGDRYRLARLPKIKHEDVSRFFDTYGGSLNKVPSVVPLGDGSYEIAVLDLHCTTLKDRLGKTLPKSDFHLNYNLFEPTDTDLQFWDYHTTKKLHQDWIFKRAIRTV